MGSFEPIVIIYGSPKIISTVNLRLPVSSLFVFNDKFFEDILNTSSDLSNRCLNRYFVVLLESIDENILKNHQIISIYNREIKFDYNQKQLNQMKNSFKQLTLDLSNDIIQFLKNQSEKEMKLGRIHLVTIYHQQIRILKEWIMAFFKAEPSHILLISLNSTQENLDNTQQKLQQICTKLGYNSTIIRQLNDYIPDDNENNSSLLPYSKLLFNNEDPNYICQLINKLSSIKLYLYGNELCDLNNWSKLMIENEKELMDDEDNWCTFIENEFIDNDIKWNFAFNYGKQWKISRVSPMNLNQLSDDPRFQSALRRSHITYYERQIEVTSDIFYWYNDAIEQGHLHIEPKLLFPQSSMKFRHRLKNANELVRSCLFQRLFSFDYPKYTSSKKKSIKFIWLDEMLYDTNENFHQMIKPYQWEYFDNLSNCITFIEKQIRQESYIFLIVSGTLGQELFSTTFSLIKQIYATYVYCAHLAPNFQWTKQYSQIRGVYNDHIKLAKHIKRDYNQLKQSTSINNSSIIDQQDQISNQSETIDCFLPLPLTVYNPEEPHLFMSHQRTIDTLLCMPHTSESKIDMIEEFRRIYDENPVMLSEIDDFKYTYELNSAVYWYTRDSFICRTINQCLRLSDVDKMFKFRHILTDIYSHLNQSYQEHNLLYYQLSSEIYYRGQLMSENELNFFKKNIGNIISINTFLSTTRSMQVALMYAGKYQENSHLISVVFNIEKDSNIHTRPYANISHYSLFPDEDETLFAMGSIFKIINIRQLPNAEHISIIYLKMTDQNDSLFIKKTS